MQSTSCKILGWMNQKLKSRRPGEIATVSDMLIIPPCGRKKRGTEEPLDKGEREKWKCWLKTQHSKTKIMASGPITSWQIGEGKVEIVTAFIFLDSKITVDSDWSFEIKRCLLLGNKAMTNLDNMLNSRHITVTKKGLYSQSYGISNSHLQMWELDHKKGWALKNWCLQFKLILMEINL